MLLLFLELINPLLFCLVYVLGGEALPTLLEPSFICQCISAGFDPGSSEIAFYV